MLALRQALLSAALCAALTAPSHASNSPDENTSTNSNTLITAPAAPAAPWDIETSNAAKVENANHPLMSLNRGTLTEVCQILAENDHADAIANLGQTSIHMAGRILRPVGGYPGLFQDEFTRINNPDMRQAIRVDLRKAINAREAGILIIMDERAIKERMPVIDSWRDLLGENAPLRNLCWANDMLSPQNVRRLMEHRLLEMLTEMDHRTKALALGASAAEIFTKEMGESQRRWIIITALQSYCSPSTYKARGVACRDHLFTKEMNGDVQSDIIMSALKSSRPLSEYAALGEACKQHLFTAMMGGYAQVRIITVALESSHPVSEYAALGEACKQHLCTKDMDGSTQSYIIGHTLYLSRAQRDILVSECKQRPQENSYSRYEFINGRSLTLRAGK